MSPPRASDLLVIGGGLHGCADTDTDAGLRGLAPESAPFSITRFAASAVAPSQTRRAS